MSDPSLKFCIVKSCCVEVQEIKMILPKLSGTQVIKTNKYICIVVVIVW